MVHASYKWLLPCMATASSMQAWKECLHSYVQAIHAMLAYQASFFRVLSKPKG